MLDLEQFFKHYLVDHHLYKVSTLKNIIDQYEEVKPLVLKGVTGVEDDKYIDSLRAEIRSTYYHAIETLFELIFALCPRNGRIHNVDLWFNVSTSNWRNNYTRIEEIASGDTTFLDQIVTAGSDKIGDNINVALGQYIFYFSITDPEVTALIPDSLGAIKEALRIFATEFKDRDEYNALKHSMRVCKILESFSIKSQREDAKWHQLVNMEGSMSYLKEEEDNSISVYAVPMDTERDVEMTVLCSALISNIVMTRRRQFIDNANESMTIAMLTREILGRASKRNKQLKKFRFTLHPIDPDT